jgi:Predicted membrane protein
MILSRRATQILFAIGIASLGALALVYGANGVAWYSVPAWVPLRAAVTYGSGIVLLGTGIGLLFERSAGISARILLLYLIAWLILRIPAIAKAPLTEVNWQNAGELAAILAGAWVLFGRLDVTGSSKSDSSIAGRVPRFLFVFALVAFGLSHFAYAAQTTSLVPAWLPFRPAWTYITGAGHIAAAIGVLLLVYARLAAALEASMLSVFTVLVWIPAIIATPKSLPTWTEFVISFAITAGAWVVADSLPQRSHSLFRSGDSSRSADLR